LRKAFDWRNQTAKVDNRITLGAVTQQVDVTDYAPVLTRPRPRSLHRDGIARIANLPLQTRNYNQLTLLVPARDIARRRQHRPEAVQRGAPQYERPTRTSAN